MPCYGDSLAAPMEPIYGEADSKYLAQVLGSALQKALAEICERRPWDPIEYLALWLRKYAQNMKRQQQVCKFLAFIFTFC